MKIASTKFLDYYSVSRHDSSHPDAPVSSTPDGAPADTAIAAGGLTRDNFVRALILDHPRQRILDISAHARISDDVITFNIPTDDPDVELLLIHS